SATQGQLLAPSTRLFVQSGGELTVRNARPHPQHRRHEQPISRTRRTHPLIHQLWNPQLGRSRVAEFRPHHTHHFVAHTAEVHAAANDGRLTAEGVPPERVAEYDHEVPALLRACAVEGPAQKRTAIEELEEVAHRSCTMNAAW